MRYERPTSRRGDSGSPYGESDPEVREASDEQRLYGEPCHEQAPDRNEQTLYGEPQHETREARELPDLELLFVRMQAQSATGPAVRRSQQEGPQTKPTEQ